MSRPGTMSPLHTEIARALKMSDFEAPGGEPVYLPEEMADKKAQAFYERVTEAVRSGELLGGLALRAYQNAAPKTGQRLLWHGTPHEIKPLGGCKFIKPRQAFWSYSGMKFAHGDRPAICAADHYKFPLIRSLLHRAQLPDSEAPALTISHDKFGRPWNLTSKAFVDGLREKEAKGYVHALRIPMNGAARKEYLMPYEDKQLGYAWEYRISNDAVSEVEITATADDLPNDVLALDANKEQFQEFYLSLPTSNPVVLAEQMGLNIASPAGMLPLELHPSLVPRDE